MLATVDAALSGAAPGTQQGYGAPGEEAAQRGNCLSSLSTFLQLNDQSTPAERSWNLRKRCLVWGWVSGEVQQQEMEGFLCAEWEESQDHPRTAGGLVLEHRGQKDPTLQE